MVFFISPDILDPNQDNSCCYLVSFILIFFPTNVLSTFPYYSHRAVDVVNVSRSVNLSVFPSYFHRAMDVGKVSVGNFVKNSLIKYVLVCYSFCDDFAGNGPHCAMYL